MTSSDPTPPVSPKSRRSGDFLWILLALLIAGGLFAAVFFLPVRNYFPSLPMAVSAESSSVRLDDIEHKIQALDARVSALEARGENTVTVPVPAAPAGEQSSTHAPAPADIGHVQSDLAQLAATVGALQDQVKQTSAAEHNATHAALARMIAFVQLREAALSDRGFASELEAMRAAAKDDAGIKEPLDRLASYADKGVPSVALLREQLAGQASAADIATAKAEAQTWWERILAELRGLVLIRPLHGGTGENDTLDKMKAALAQDDIATALAAMKNLPPEAQQVLDGWRKQAEARAAIMDSLQTIATRLAADTDAKAPPSDQDDKDTP